MNTAVALETLTVNAYNRLGQVLRVGLPLTQVRSTKAFLNTNAKFFKILNYFDGDSVIPLNNQLTESTE